MIRLIDREYELSLLNEEWDRKGAKLAVIYGRRRVGKTRLVVEFTKGKSGVFFIAEDVSKKVQIGELKSKLSEFLKDDFLRKTEIAEWRDLFEYLGKVIPRKHRFYIAIDEFSYIIKNDPAVVSSLQKFWDTFLSDTQVFLLLSGSIFGLMSENVLSSTSPLYGRRARDVLVKPLPFQHARKFLRMPFEECLKVYMSTGGVPEYLLKAGNYGNAADFWAKEFMRRDGYFYREPYFLLSQEFREIKTYFTILNAIAYGNTKPTDIANFTGVGAREIYPYLDSLIRLGFVERIAPVLGDRKAGIYVISDVFFDFWFNFVFNNREGIERGNITVEKQNINRYLGKRFELNVRNELFHMFFSGFDKAGRWWHKDKEIDIVAVNEKMNEIVFAECKWEEDVNPDEILQELREKANFVKWRNGERKERYAIFAKSFIRRVKNKDVMLFGLKELGKAVENAS